MKKLLILTAFLSSLIMTSVANAEWTAVGESKTAGDTYYVDFERIKKQDGKVYYWALCDYLKPSPTGVMSETIYTEAECGSFRYRWLTDTFYKGPMATGDVSSSNNTPMKNWYYPSSDSVAEIILNAVCNHKTMQ